MNYYLSIYLMTAAPSTVFHLTTSALLPSQVIQSHPARDSSTARLDSVQDELVQLEVREKQLQVRGRNIGGGTGKTCTDLLLEVV